MNCKKRLGLMPAQRLKYALEMVFAQADCAGDLAQIWLSIDMFFKVLDCLLDTQVIFGHLVEISNRDIHGVLSISKFDPILQISIPKIHPILAHFSLSGVIR